MSNKIKNSDDFQMVSALAGIFDTFFQPNIDRFVDSGATFAGQTLRAIVSRQNEDRRKNSMFRGAA